MHSKELPNIVTLIAEHIHGPLSEHLLVWQEYIFSVFIIILLSVFAICVSRHIRRNKSTPSRVQNLAEIFVEGVDNFVCGILGHHGRKYVPFIGTLFIYILLMDLLGIIPFFKSPTANWSMTFALAICVFAYVQFTSFKELGVRGYVYHLMGKPKGMLAFSIVLPAFMFLLHLIGELIRPFSLSLRLRGNMWGDEVMMGLLTGFGLSGLPMLLFNGCISLIAMVVQAFVFSLLTTIYFALILIHEE